jgi:hypothetical protein
VSYLAKKGLTEFLWWAARIHKVLVRISDLDLKKIEEIGE